ncbi:hypothetical protein ABT56_00905 [Photobacterium aquae]|uniref:Uncharacterized protein n=1 Tax=Photobacterium aquae TaxID=1195763 RepID=A0A0J1HB08_9GAMM|nr:hypothetical protein [Photobacterium aquae]KLV08819.1 hypothetical protein ABT56_00905 [Photobacterium aquae]
MAPQEFVEKYQNKQIESNITYNHSSIVYSIFNRERLKPIPFIFSASTIVYLLITIAIFIDSGFKLNFDTTFMALLFASNYLPAIFAAYLQYRYTLPIIINFQNNTIRQGKKPKLFRNIVYIEVERDNIKSKLSKSYVKRHPDEDLPKITVNIHMGMFRHYCVGSFKSTELAYEYATDLALLLEHKSSVTISNPYIPYTQL